MPDRSSRGARPPWGRRSSTLALLPRELRLALRSLRRRPGFTAGAVLILAAGLFSATTTWGVLHDVLVAPLGYRAEDRLVGLWMKAKRGNEITARFGVSDAQIAAVRDRSRTLEEVAYYNVTVGPGVLEPDDGPAVRAERALVSWNFFTMLGVGAAVGRTFGPADAGAGAGATTVADVVVLSDAAWARHFGRDPGVVGRSVRLAGRPRLVLGVLPPGFRWADLERPAEFWLPQDLVESRATPFFFWAVGRRAPGVAPAVVEQELSGLFEGVLEAAGVPMQDIPGPLATVVPLRESQLGSVAPQLPGVVAAVACVLALALANLTLLFLMRVVSRRRETLVRGALGGGPTRALAPVLAEAVLVCAAAFLVAVAAAGAALPAIRAAAPAGVPRIDTVSFSWEVLVGGTLAALLALALVSGAAVAAARRHGLAAGLQWAAQQVGGDGLPRGVRRGLIAGQVALALVLMTGATLMARSLVRLEGVDVGFQAAGLLQGRLVLPTDAFWEPAGGQGQPGDFRVLRIRPALESFRAELTRRLAAHPAVRQVALAKHTPLSGRYGGFTPFVREGWEGRDPPEGQNWITANDVDPAFLPMLGVRLVAGRWLTPDDDAGAPPVALISDALARRFWPDGDAVGGRFRGGRLVAADDGYAFEDHWVEVVGVVRSLREWDYRVSDETVYVPLAQSYPTGTPVPASGRGPRLSMFLRHDGPPGPVADHVRAVAAELLPGVPVDDLRPMTALVDDWLREPRFYAALLAAFGALGLGVAAGGIAALIAFGVSRRTREIGIRVALGAAAAQVVRAITGDVLIAGLAGLALGVWAAALLGRALEALLFEVGSADPLAVAAAAALVAAAGALALAGAVRRALAVDPVEALRAE